MDTLKQKIDDVMRDMQSQMMTIEQNEKNTKLLDARERSLRLLEARLLEKEQQILKDTGIMQQEKQFIAKALITIKEKEAIENRIDGKKLLLEEKEKEVKQLEVSVRAQEQVVNKKLEREQEVTKKEQDLIDKEKMIQKKEELLLEKQRDLELKEEALQQEAGRLQKIAERYSLKK